MDSKVTPKQVSRYVLTLGVQVLAIFVWEYFPAVSTLLSFLFYPLLFGTTSLLVKDKFLTYIFVIQCMLMVLFGSYLENPQGTDQVGRALTNLNFHATLITSLMALYAVLRRIKPQINSPQQIVVDLLFVMSGGGVTYVLYILLIKVGEG